MTKLCEIIVNDTVAVQAWAVGAGWVSVNTFDFGICARTGEVRAFPRTFTTTNAKWNDGVAAQIIATQFKRKAELEAWTATQEAA